MKWIHTQPRAALLFTALALILAAAIGCRPQQRQPQPGARAPQSPIQPSAAVCPTPATAAPATPAAPAWQPITGQTVILDPGHGGKDNGSSHFGLVEKDVNLDLARRAAVLLQARGARVLLTRDRDVFVPLEQRSAFANRNPGAVFVSIHVNASSFNPNAAGVETFVLSSQYTDAERARQAASRFKMNGARTAQGGEALASLTTQCRTRGPALAASLQRSLSGRLGEIDRGVKPKDLAVLRETYFCTAVLVETGFVTNARTAERMRTDDWRRRAAEGLADGIADFLRQP